MPLYRTVSDRGLWKKYNKGGPQHFHKPHYIDKSNTPQVTYSQLDLEGDKKRKNSSSSTTTSNDRHNSLFVDNVNIDPELKFIRYKSAPSSRCVTPTRFSYKLRHYERPLTSASTYTTNTETDFDDRASFESRSLTAFSNYSERDKENPFIVGSTLNNEATEVVKMYLNNNNNIRTHSVPREVEQPTYSNIHEVFNEDDTPPNSTSSPKIDTRRIISSISKSYADSPRSDPIKLNPPKVNKYLLTAKSTMPSDTVKSYQIPQVHHAEVVHLREDDSSSSSDDDDMSATDDEEEEEEHNITIKEQMSNNEFVTPPAVSKNPINTMNNNNNYENGHKGSVESRSFRDTALDNYDDAAAAAASHQHQLSRQTLKKTAGKSGGGGNFLSSIFRKSNDKKSKKNLQHQMQQKRDGGVLLNYESSPSTTRRFDNEDFNQLQGETDIDADPIPDDVSRGTLNRKMSLSRPTDLDAIKQQYEQELNEAQKQNEVIALQLSTQEFEKEKLREEKLLADQKLEIERIQLQKQLEMEKIQHQLELDRKIAEMEKEKAELERKIIDDNEPKYSNIKRPLEVIRKKPMPEPQPEVDELKNKIAEMENKQLHDTTQEIDIDAVLGYNDDDNDNQLQDNEEEERVPTPKVDDKPNYQENEKRSFFTNPNKKSFFRLSGKKDKTKKQTRPKSMSQIGDRGPVDISHLIDDPASEFPELFNDEKEIENDKHSSKYNSDLTDTDGEEYLKPRGREEVNQEKQKTKSVSNFFNLANSWSRNRSSSLSSNKNKRGRSEERPSNNLAKNPSNADIRNLKEDYNNYDRDNYRSLPRNHNRKKPPPKRNQGGGFAALFGTGPRRKKDDIRRPSLSLRDNNTTQPRSSVSSGQLRERPSPMNNIRNDHEDTIRDHDESFESTLNESSSVLPKSRTFSDLTELNNFTDEKENPEEIKAYPINGSSESANHLPEAVRPSVEVTPETRPVNGGGGGRQMGRRSGRFRRSGSSPNPPPVILPKNSYGPSPMSSVHRSESYKQAAIVDDNTLTRSRHHPPPTSQNPAQREPPPTMRNRYSHSSLPRFGAAKKRLQAHEQKIMDQEMNEDERGNLRGFEWESQGHRLPSNRGRGGSRGRGQGRGRGRGPRGGGGGGGGGGQHQDPCKVQ